MGLGEMTVPLDWAIRFAQARDAHVAAVRIYRGLHGEYERMGQRYREARNAMEETRRCYDSIVEQYVMVALEDTE